MPGGVNWMAPAGLGLSGLAGAASGLGSIAQAGSERRMAKRQRKEQQQSLARARNVLSGYEQQLKGVSAESPQLSEDIRRRTREEFSRRGMADTSGAITAENEAVRRAQEERLLNILSFQQELKRLQALYA